MTTPIFDQNVQIIFDAYPKRLKADLLRLRDIIFDTARNTEGVGELVETLKWREPAYLPKKPNVGTTVRINAIRGSSKHYAVFFHCRTNLVQWIKQTYPNTFMIEGNRALIFSVGEDLPEQPLRHCIARALTYHYRPSPK
jgi:hypothetical protein